VQRFVLPHIGTGIDWSQPLARGLAMASRAPGTTADLVSGQWPTLTGGEYGTSRVGPTRRSTASANDTVWPSWPSGLEPTSGGTALLLHAKTDATLRESCLFSLGGNGGVQSNRFSVHGPWTDGTVYFDFGDGRLVADTTATGGWSTPNLLRAWAFSAGARGMSIWRDGLQLASSATAVSRPATGGQRYLSAAPFGYGSDLTDVALMLVWTRQLSAEELRAVTLNPWQIFATKNRLWISPAAGTTSLTPANARHANRTAAAGLSSAQTLAPFSAGQAHRLAAPALTATASLSPATARHAQQTQSASLNGGTHAPPASARQSLRSTAGSISTSAVLAVASAHHVHRAASSNLSQAGTTTPVPARHANRVQQAMLALPPTTGRRTRALAPESRVHNTPSVDRTRRVDDL
jgi:hypothetical protein